MKFLGYKNMDLKWATALILVIPIWMGLAPKWYSCYGGTENWLWMKWLYDLLDDCWLVNIPICIVLGYFVFRWCQRIWKDNDLRLYRPPLAVIGLVFLYWKSQVVYAKIVWELDYRMFLNGLLLIALSVMLIKDIRKTMQCYKNKKVTEPEENEQKESQNTKGFSNDNVENEDIPESLISYASLIVERLADTNINKQSYAVGVIGEWGVGKTTFLKLLKKQIEGKAEVVEFNPWMCRTPEQVTQDFFASLRHQLSSKHSTLSKSIKEYAKYVSKLTLTPHTAFSLDMILPVGEESLYERKQSLSDKFSYLPHPVVVIIDDVDRLEREEVFEVLRLIRNTADLSNTIYIVAYDKEYVTCVLEEKNIKNASAYLEKIFPVELHLPKVEDYLIWEAFYSDVNAQDSFSGKFAELLFAKFKNNERALILRVLDNYRRAKRFARLYMLNVSYLKKQSPDEINLVDLFWLEILQMYDKRAYNKLANEPGSLLYRDNERFKIRNGILRNATDKDKNAYTGEKFWKEETPNILDMIFGNYIQTTKLSICFTENYEKYFTLGVSPFKLSIKEMNELFDNDTKPDEVVSNWVDSGKYFDSIAYQLKQVDVNKLKDNKLKAFVSGILCFGMRIAAYRNNQVWTVKKMLREKQYNEDAKRIAHITVLSWIEKKLEDEKVLIQLCRLLNGFYVTIEYDDQNLEMKSFPLVISNMEVEDLLVMVIKSYLEKHPEITALDVIKEKGTLASLFKNCCVTVENAMRAENYCHYKQVAFDVVIGHFARKDVKPTQKEFEDAYGAMFHQETPEFDNPLDEYNYWDYMNESYDQKMQEYFGSSYDSKEDNKLEEFKNKCFVANQV